MNGIKSSHNDTMYDDLVANIVYVLDGHVHQIHTILQ